MLLYLIEILIDVIREGLGYITVSVRKNQFDVSIVFFPESIAKGSSAGFT